MAPATPTVDRSLVASSTVSTNDPSPLDLDAPEPNHPLVQDKPKCARRAGEYLNRRTGELLPSMCGANFCGVCGRFNTVRRIWAIYYAEPTHLVTLTDVGSDPKMIRAARKEAFRLLRRARYEFEAAYSVECNKTHGVDQEHQHHMHLLVLGPRVPGRQAWSEAAGRVGFGVEVHVRRVRRLRGDAGYILKEMFNPAQAQHHLDMNDGSPVNTTARFNRLDGEYLPGGWENVLIEADRRRKAAAAETNLALRRSSRQTFRVVSVRSLARAHVGGPGTPEDAPFHA